MSSVLRLITERKPCDLKARGCWCAVLARESGICEDGIALLVFFGSWVWLGRIALGVGCALTIYTIPSLFSRRYLAHFATSTSQPLGSVHLFPLHAASYVPVSFPPFVLSSLEKGEGEIGKGCRPNHATPSLARLGLELPSQTPPPPPYHALNQLKPPKSPTPTLAHRERGGPNGCTMHRR